MWEGLCVCWKNRVSSYDPHVDQPQRTGVAFQDEHVSLFLVGEMNVGK